MDCQSLWCKPAKNPDSPRTTVSVVLPCAVDIYCLLCGVHVEHSARQAEASELV